MMVDGVSHLLFYKQLNPGSLFPPAYEVSIFPLTHLLERQREQRWQIIGAGALVSEGKVIPPRSLVLGVPGRVVRSLTDEEVARINAAADHYVENARRFAAGLAAQP